MIEPNTLSVADLAARWTITQQQVIEHALSLRVPLYFPFEGLLFDMNDDWLPHGKDWEVRHKAESLTEFIAGREQQLRRRSRGQVSQWEQQLSSEEAQRLRQDITADSIDLKEIHLRLELRDQDRNKHSYRGYVRVGPSNLWDILRLGSTAHPHLGFHPRGAIRVAVNNDGRGHDGQAYWEGAIVKLEPLPGHHSFGKDRLTADDLFAPMEEVKAVERCVASKAVAIAAQAAGDAETQTADCTSGLANSARRGLSTDGICDAFDGLGRTGAEWRQLIGKTRPKWLLDCEVSPGKRGQGSLQATWDPVGIAAALALGKPRRAPVPAEEIDLAFRRKPALRPWLKDWSKFREDNPFVG